MNDTLPSPAPARSDPVKYRVFVIDDHALMRRSFIDAIERESDLMVCGQAEDVPEALAAIAWQRPDLVLTDLELKTSSGLTLIAHLHSLTPPIPVVATTMFDVRRNERLVRAAGANAFVPKQDGPEKLIAAIHSVINSTLKKP